jgi:2-polyprenyl-6-methoxyphenol hydroxylase-like FAD-dependent oxidoreductase
VLLAVVVDRHGKVTATLPTDGPEGATAELEVLRGDLARTILDALPDRVALVYGDSIKHLDDTGPTTTVTTETGRTLHADLVVVAEGVRSRTRALVFDEEEVRRRDMEITMVVGTIPRTPEDTLQWRWHNAVGGRSVHLRPDNHGTTRAILAYSPGDDLTVLDRTAALTVVRDRYRDVGWAAPRILDALPHADDLYIDKLTQIRMDTWHRGRTVVVGDAAWCVTLMGGGGSSLALIGGYILARSLHGARDGDLDRGLRAYEEWMRPLVSSVQRIPLALVHFAYPRTRIGLATRRVADKLLTTTLLRLIVQRLHTRGTDTQPLPRWGTTI